MTWFYALDEILVAMQAIGLLTLAIGVGCLIWLRHVRPVEKEE